MGKSTNNLVAIVAVVAVIGILGYMAFAPSLTASVVTAGGDTVTPSDVKCTDIQCNVIPTYTYNAVNAYSATALVGDDQIKQNGNAPTTTLANPSKCDKIEYWFSNITDSFCEIATQEQAACGSQQIESKCYRFTALTITAKDLADDDYLTNTNMSVFAMTNTTLGANGVANIQLKVQGTAKFVAMPFGGCMAVDYPTTIASVTATYNGAALNACPYVWTYTATTTGNAYRLFEIPAGFDKAALGDIKNINLQLLAGSSNPAGGVNIAFRAANYYITNDGNFAMGVEQDKNQATTATFTTAAGSRAFVID